MLSLFIIIALAVVAAVAIVGELKRPKVYLPVSKSERVLQVSLLVVLGLTLFAVA